MEQVKPPRKALFVFVWGVLIWGGSTALAITLFDWYTTHRVDAPYKVAGRFVIFMAVGILCGLLLWNRREALGGKKHTLTGIIVRLVLFISLMLGLSYVLWTMARSQTATQSQLSNDSIQILNAKLRLGMTEAEVAEKLSGAQITRQGKDWILQNDSSVIQFDNGRLAFAGRAWTNENNDVVEALFGVVSYLNEEGHNACSVSAEGASAPNLNDEGSRTTLREVRIKCVDKSILIDKVTMNGHDYNSVMEGLGRRKRNSEDKPQ